MAPAAQARPCVSDRRCLVRQQVVLCCGQLQRRQHHPSSADGGNVRSPLMPRSARSPTFPARRGASAPRSTSAARSCASTGRAGARRNGYRGEAEALQSVSCPTVSFCMAVSDRNYTTRAHGRWSAPTNFGDEFFAVSCASKRFCIASTFNAGLLRYDGAGWHQISTMAVSAVSCAPGAPACLAISDEGDSVVVHRKSIASPQDTGDNSGFFRAVSCSSVSFCAALDGRGRTLEWSRGTWTAPAAASGRRPRGAVVHLAHLLRRGGRRAGRHVQRLPLDRGAPGGARPRVAALRLLRRS